MMKSLFALSFLALFAVQAQAENMNSSDPVTRGIDVSQFPRTKQIAPGVYTFEAFRASGEPNNGQMTTVSLFVVGKDGVLLADLWDDLVLPRAIRSVWSPVIAAAS